MRQSWKRSKGTLVAELPFLVSTADLSKLDPRKSLIQNTPFIGRNVEDSAPSRTSNLNQSELLALLTGVAQNPDPPQATSRAPVQNLAAVLDPENLINVLQAHPDLISAVSNDLPEVCEHLSISNDLIFNVIGTTVSKRYVRSAAKSTILPDLEPINIDHQ